MEEASTICLIYQVVRYHKDEDSEEYTRTYYGVFTKVSGFASQYIILWPGSLWYPVRSSALKNKRIFSLVHNFKISA